MRRVPILAAALVAVAFVAEAPAAADPPAPASSPAAAKTDPVDRILECLDINPLVDTTVWRARVYLNSRRYHENEDPVARPLLVAAAKRPSLRASERKVVAALPAKVKAAALRFCQSKAGRLWHVLLLWFPGYGPNRPKVKMPAGNVDRARTLIADGHLKAIHWRSVRLSVLSAAGARTLSIRAIHHPHLWTIVRRYLDWRLYAFIDATTRLRLRKDRAILDHQVLVAVAARIEGLPDEDLAPIRAFLTSPAGVALIQAARDAVEAAMNDAWHRMLACDVAGKILLGCP